MKSIYLFFIIKCISTLFINTYSKRAFIDVIEMIVQQYIYINKNILTCGNRFFCLIKAMMTQGISLFPSSINHKIGYCLSTHSIFFEDIFRYQLGS